ncbi:hypothetical protein KAJ89_05365 [Candidatus Parcubacteria bacterium]|nr:hypothetical protein [Candidatus Parcubacteria bacterium]
MYKKTIIIIVIAIIFFFIGAGSSYLYQAKKCSLTADPNNTFTAGWEAAKERLRETGLVQISQNQAEFTSLTGKVVKKLKDSMEISTPAVGPLANPDLNIRIIDMDTQTKIYKIIEKNSEEFEQELALFNQQFSNEQIVNNPNAPIPPSRFKQVVAHNDDIEKGQMVTIATNEDVKEIKRFTAKEITIRY